MLQNPLVSESGAPVNPSMEATVPLVPRMQMEFDSNTHHLNHHQIHHTSHPKAIAGATYQLTSASTPTAGDSSCSGTSDEFISKFLFNPYHVNHCSSEELSSHSALNLEPNLPSYQHHQLAPLPLSVDVYDGGNGNSVYYPLEQAKFSWPSEKVHSDNYEKTKARKSSMVGKTSKLNARRQRGPNKKRRKSVELTTLVTGGITTLGKSAKDLRSKENGNKSINVISNPDATNTLEANVVELDLEDVDGDEDEFECDDDDNTSTAVNETNATETLALLQSGHLHHHTHAHAHHECNSTSGTNSSKSTCPFDHHGYYHSHSHNVPNGALTLASISPHPPPSSPSGEVKLCCREMPYDNAFHHHLHHPNVHLPHLHHHNHHENHHENHHLNHSSQPTFDALSEQQQTKIDDTSMDSTNPTCNDTVCFGCRQSLSTAPIIASVSGYHKWHINCLCCSECGQSLSQSRSCYIRHGRIYCKSDYLRLIHCCKCYRPIAASDWVRRAGELVYHLACFACDYCHRQLSTGEKFTVEKVPGPGATPTSLSVAGDYRLLCKLHFGIKNDNEDLAASDLCQSDPEQSNGSSTALPLNGATGTMGQCSSVTTGTTGTTGTNNNNNSSTTLRTTSGSDVNGRASSSLSITTGSSSSVGSVNSTSASANSKTKRVRTTFTEDQLSVLQANFQLDSNPDGQDLERIAALTGLSKRVTQVWFQNSRARQKKYLNKSQRHAGLMGDAGPGSQVGPGGQSLSLLLNGARGNGGPMVSGLWSPTSSTGSSQNGTMGGNGCENGPNSSAGGAAGQDSSSSTHQLSHSASAINQTAQQQGCKGGWLGSAGGPSLGSVSQLSQHSESSDQSLSCSPTNAI